MAEYIKREDVIDAIENFLEIDKYFHPYSRGKVIPISEVVSRVNEIHTADVQPVTWIPVTERLPDFEGMCLCMRKSYSKANFRHQEIMYFDYDEQAFCSNVDGIFVADGNVTHWMPLPKPPKDGDNNG